MSSRDDALRRQGQAAFIPRQERPKGCREDSKNWWGWKLQGSIAESAVGSYSGNIKESVPSNTTSTDRGTSTPVPLPWFFCVCLV